MRDFFEASAQFRFRVLLIGNVDIRADIASENVARLEARNSRAQHPTIFSVGPAQPALYLEVLSGIEGRRKARKGAFQVLRMQTGNPAAAQFLVQLATCKVQPGLVEKAEAFV